MSENNEQTEILREILKWIKVSSYREVKDLLDSILKTNTEKLIYQYSNGENTSTEVVKKAKSSSQKVSDSWKEWNIPIMMIIPANSMCTSYAESCIEPHAEHYPIFERPKFLMDGEEKDVARNSYFVVLWRQK